MSKQQNKQALFSPTPKSAQKVCNSGVKQMKSIRGDLNSANKQMKSPNACLMRTDSAQENGLIMGSMGGGNTPTPHKFNGG